MQLAGLITDVKTIGERIKWARDQRKLTQAVVAARAGVSQGTIGNAESGARGKPRELLQIARALGASANWLESGRGNWQEEEPNVSQIKARRRVPLISWVQAGQWVDIQDMYAPGEADEWEETYDSLPGNHAFALRVSGDSMTSPIPGARSFPPGTILIVDPERSTSAGDFVIAKDVDTQKATFKQLTTDGGRWFLKPLNPSYPTVEIDDPSIRVIGKVIEYQIREKL